jgi:hypothetical protein
MEVQCAQNNTVTYIPIARQRFGKYVPASKQASTRETVFYLVRAMTLAIQWCGKHA